MNVSLEEPDYTDYYLDLDTAGVRNESLPPYSVTFFTSSCRFWNERQETWSSDGCEVSATQEEALYYPSYGCRASNLPPGGLYSRQVNDTGKMTQRLKRGKREMKKTLICVCLHPDLLLSFVSNSPTPPRRPGGAMVSACH